MKNFHKVRGKREFLFDDRELVALGGGACIICVLIFVLGLLIGQGLGERSVVSALDNQEFVASEEVAAVESEEVSDNTSVAESSSPAEEVSANEKQLQRSYSNDITPPEEEVVVDVPTPESSSASVSEELQPEKIGSESSQQAVKEETLPGTVAAAPVPSSQDSQDVAVAHGALPPVPMNRDDPMPVGRQAYNSEESPILAGTVYSVQVSSSPDRVDSEGLQQKFMDLGYQAYVVPADLGGTIWFRVMVGNVGTHEEAEQLREDILTRASHLAGNNNPFVTKVSE